MGWLAVRTFSLNVLVGVLLVLNGCTERTPLSDVLKLGDECKSDASVIPCLKLTRHEKHRVLLRIPADYSAPARIAAAKNSADVLIKKGFRLRQNPVLDITSPIDWGANPRGDRNWSFAVNSWTPLDPLFVAYAASGDYRYYEVARKAAIDWVEYNLVARKPNSMKWHDMATGLRAFYLANLIDYELRSKDADFHRLSLYLKAARSHIEFLSDPGTFPSGNHGIFMMMGLRALAKAVPELQGAGHATAYSSKQLKAILRDQYSEESFHTEDSPAYHLFVTATLERLCKQGSFGDVPELERVVAVAGEHKHKLFHPNGDTVQIGDSAGSGLQADPKFKEFFASGGTRGTAPPRLAGFFPDAGYAILRSPWIRRPFAKHSFLFLATEQHGTGHTHADPFTFEWSELGQPIIVDSGKFSYDEDKWRDFFKSTRAGNTVEIDSSDDRIRRGNPGGGELRSLTHLEGDVWSIETQAQRSDFLFRALHTRLLVINQEDWLLVVDTLASEVEHEYRQWFGFHEDAEVAEETNGFRATFPDKNVVFLQELHENGRPVLKELHRGEEHPRIQGWISRDYRKKTPRYSAAFRKRGKRVQFVSLFSLRAPPTQVSVSSAHGRVRIRLTSPTGVDERVDYSGDSGLTQVRYSASHQ